MEIVLLSIFVAIVIVGAFAAGYYLREPIMKRESEWFNEVLKQNNDLLGSLYQRMGYKPTNVVQLPQGDVAQKDNTGNDDRGVAEIPKIPDIFKRREEALRRDKERFDRMN